MGKIGETLRNARIDQGLTYEKIEADTRIRRRYLEALEEENWKALPEAVYTKGFLSSYARYLGLDAHRMLDIYRQIFQPPPEIPLAEPKAKVILPSRPRWKKGLLIGIFAIIILVFSQYVYRNVFLPPSDIEQQGQKPGETNGENMTEGTNGQETPALPGSQDDGTAPPPEQKVTAITLRIRSVGSPCWVRVISDKQIIFEQTLKNGEEKVIGDLPDVTFTLGSAGAVQVFLNDQDIGTLGKIGQVVTKKYLLENNEIKEVSTS